MKLHHERDVAIGSKSVATFNFQIEANEKTFQMMMGSLYTNPIEAFVRELGTNAYEAHQMVGKEDVPFEVTIPTLTHPSFVIKDFGPGLSVEEVKNLYTVLMKSSKEKSNDMGGCFGLGSKSPFAYTSNFGVESIHNDIKYCYIVNKNAHGLPEMNLMHSEPTTEPSGLKISIPIKSEDIRKTVSIVNQIYFWFNTRPIITNAEYNFPYSLTEERDGYSLYEGISRPHAKMGNIVYPISSYSVKLKEFASVDCVIDFEIGDITPTPSRDGLQYDDKTVRAIQSKIDTIIAKERQRIQDEVDKCSTYLEACKLAIQNVLFGIGNFKWKGNVLTDRLTKYESRYQYYNYAYDALTKRSKSYYDKLSVTENYLYFYQENSKKPFAKIVHYLQANNIDRATIIININKDAKKKPYNFREVTVDNFVSDYYIDAKDVIHINNLTAPKAAPRVGSSTAGLKMLTRGKWEPVKDVADNDIKYYVELKHDKVLFNNQSIENYSLVNLLSITGFSDNIYGFNQAIIKKYDMSEYVNIIEHLKNDIIKTWEKAMQYGDAATLANSIENVNLNKIKGKIPDDIQDILSEYVKAKQILNGTSESAVVERIIKIFFPNESLLVPKNSFSKKLKQVLDKYPLLKYTYEVPANELCKYFELVNKS